VIAKGAPGYKPVVEWFGRYVLTADGQIDRPRLGRIVFSDPEALAVLEKIVHPLVDQAIDYIVQRARQPVIVIEAIKLLESNIARNIDSVWVVDVPREVQLARLMKNRGMTEADARRRIDAQPPQQKKVAAAQVVIKNNASFQETWRQVTYAWQRFVPVSIEESEQAVAPAKPASPEAQREALNVLRGRPRHSAVIAELFNRLSGQRYSPDDIMEAFGEKAFLLLQRGQTPVGVIGWQVENLVARTTDILFEKDLPAKEALGVLIAEMERASRDLQCEASLIFTAPRLAEQEPLWRELGYERRTPQTLEVQAWQEAARDSMPAGSTLYFKKLRQDRVLRPI
jgi:dephospho-CoA kinase